MIKEIINNKREENEITKFDGLKNELYCNQGKNRNKNIKINIKKIKYSFLIFKNK